MNNKPAYGKALFWILIGILAMAAVAWMAR